MKRRISLFSVLVLLLHLVGVTTGSAAAGQSDYEQAYDFMKTLGCVSGYTDGQSHLDDAMTRAQAITIMVNCTGFGPTAQLLAGSPAFADTARGWYSGAIALAKNLGWVTGFPDGMFHPDEKITFAQMLQMLNRVLGLKENPALGWPQSAIQTSIQAGIIAADDPLLARGNDPVTRGAMLYTANQAFLIPTPAGKSIYERYMGYVPPVIDEQPEPQPEPPQEPPASTPSSNYTPPPIVTPSVTDAVYANNPQFLTVDMTVSFEQATKLYYAVLLEPLQAPIAAQIKMGITGDVVVVAQGNFDVAGLTSYTFPITTPNTMIYGIWLVAEYGDRLSEVYELDFRTHDYFTPQ